LAADRENAKHAIHTLTVEVQALTNTIQARKNTFQALKDTVQALEDTQSKLKERETDIAKLKSMLDRIKTAAAELQRNYRQDTENWKKVATNSAARQKSYENTVATQTESIALVRKFLSDNADKFQ
jgi:methyl-accepting chemotaxis protein